MVMHARKVPRLDDGYRDLNQQEVLSKDKSSMNSHSNKYGDRKSTKFDNFDHKRHSNSPRSFNSRSAHLDNKQRDKRNYEESDPINRDTKIKEQKHKDHKSEDGFVSVLQVHKLAERVCGDWSEHISKSGKRYFYNCRTEVSQWDKPDSWTEENSTSVRNNDRVQHDVSDRSKSSSSSKANSHFGESRHSTTNNNKTFSSASASKPSSRRDGRDSRTNFREEQRSPSKNASSILPRETAQGSAPRDRTSRQDRKRPRPRRSGSRSPSYGQKSGKYGSRGSSSEAGSGGCYRNSSAKNDVVGNGGVEKKKDNGPTERVECSNADNKEPDNSRKSSPVHEDMDISPDNSFTQTEIETRTSHDGLNSKTSPHLSSVPASSSSGITNFNNNGETPSSEQPSSHAVPAAPSSNQESFHATNSGNATASSWSASSGPNSLHQQHPQQQQSLQTTLAGLQQAVLRLIPDKMSASVPGKQGNFANCVAMLSFLLTQLSNQQQSGSHSNNSDNQLIIQQAIPLLKKLQEIVVHQQQQQQQRMLQQALFQLLQMQNPAGSNVHASANQKPQGNVEKAESPYSPPDSDGSPVQTQSHNRHYPHQHHNRQSATGNRQSPRHLHQDAAHLVPVSKQTRQEKSSLEDVDERTDGSSFNAGLHSKAEKNDARPSTNSQLSSSSGSQTPSHHPSIPFYRRHNIELTPSLVNHFNPNVIDHVTNWQADTFVKQADCIAADNYTYLAPLCSQVSVELKQARSMVRVQEILSTRHEQRRIFIQHQLYELDRGLPVPSLLLPNPLTTFGQPQHTPQAQPQAQQHTPQAQQQAPATHPPPTPAIQSTPAPTPMSPQVSSAPPQITNLSSPMPFHDTHPVPLFPSTSAATVASCENASNDLT